MEIVDVRRNLVSLRNVRVVLVGRACESVSLADSLGLLEGFLRPDTCLKIGGLLLKVVHSHIEELQRRTASEEHDLVCLGNIQKLSPECAALVHSRVPLLCAVGDAENRDTCAFEILEGLNGIVDGHLRKQARAGVEYVYFLHFYFSFKVLLKYTV